MSTRPYQEEMIDFIVENPRCNLFVPMGGGKTMATLTAMDRLSLVEPVYPALVIAPVRVAVSTWPDEVKKFEHLRHIKVTAIVGTAAQRIKALNASADVFTINYENLPWLVEHLGGRWPFTTVVCDECSKLKGFRLRQGTKRARALAKHIHKDVSRYIGLTGTPAANGLQDLWALMWFVDAGLRLGRAFQSFTARWFREERIGADAHAVRLLPMPFAQRQIQDAIRDVCLTIDLTRYLDIRQPVISTIEVELPPPVRKIYDRMEREMFVELGEVEIEALQAAAKTVKCLQIANGALYTDDAGSFEPLHDAKIQALESVLEEACGAPVLCAYHFKSDLARLLKAFPKARVLDADPQTIKDWNEGRIELLLAHPASAGHGLNLQDGGNILVFFGHWWALEEYQQICERIGPTRQAQAGHNRPVFIYHIVAKRTVDELVMARRDSKRSVQEILMDAMKRRKAA